MKKNFVKKLVSVIAAAGIAGSLLAGCGNTSDAQTTAPSNDQTASADAQVAHAGADANAEQAPEIKGTITVAAVGGLFPGIFTAVMTSAICGIYYPEAVYFWE